MTDKTAPVPHGADATDSSEAERRTGQLGVDEPRVGKRSGFRTHVGYDALDWREGYAEILLDIAEPHMNSNGVAHGGALMTIIDAAMGHAATWCAVPGNARYTSTISLTTSFLDGARYGERVIARGRVVSIDNRVATCAAEVVGSDGRLIALGQASFRYATGSDRVEGVPRRTGGSNAGASRSGA